MKVKEQHTGRSGRAIVMVMWMCVSVLPSAALPADENDRVIPTLAPVCGMPFQDNAVLQQQIPLPVWGTTLPDARVMVSFDGQQKRTVADKAGKWRVVLDRLVAVRLKSANDVPKGMAMTITCEKDGKKAEKQIKNLVVGEVWICAGQSNMAGSMRTIIVKLEGGALHPKGLVKANRLLYYPADSITSAKYPALRQLTSADSQPWLVCSPETVANFKKVAYFFGRRLILAIKVPVGLVSAAVGGSRIEAWLNQKPYPTGANYGRFVKPLVGYGIRGVIWYQGESNARDKPGYGYQEKLESLITGWRAVWDQGDFPVYYVQLPGIGTSTTDKPAMGDGRAEIRQAYFQTLRLKHTGMAVTIDVGALKEHPPGKYDTGDRLARLALKKDYGFKDLATSPLYKAYKIEGRTIRISFDNAEKGLMVAEKEGFAAPNPAPKARIGWLSIQGKDGAWHWAEGTIDGSDLVVSCEAVKEPVAVRYAYTNNPTGPLLYSKDGLPVGPFSTNGYGSAAQ